MVNFEFEDVYIDGKPANLTATEFRTLSILVKKPGKVFSRHDLSYEVQGYRFIGDGRVMDVHIRNIRRKIEEDPKNPQYIVTKIGSGYKFTFPAGRNMKKTASWTITTRTCLFLAILSLTAAASIGSYMALTQIWSKQLASFKQKYAAEQSHHLLYTLRERMKNGADRSESIKILEDASRHFAVPIRYVGEDRQTMILDLVDPAWSVAPRPFFRRSSARLGRKNRRLSHFLLRYGRRRVFACHPAAGRAARAEGPDGAHLVS
ncbi:winged helix-turn-helix domain-containing protein [Paenibacillus sp. JTLBN-2024]